MTIKDRAEPNFPSCSFVRARCHAYLDGELPTSDASALRLHLDSCSHCRAFVELEAMFLRMLDRRMPRSRSSDSRVSRLLTGFRAAVSPEPA
jgi:predicted anti-sigma-YlaC factor YlaD